MPPHLDQQIRAWVFRSLQGGGADLVAVTLEITIDRERANGSGAFFLAKPYGKTDPFDLFTEVRKYQVRDVASQITTPMLILNPDNEQFFPGQPQQLYDLLPGEKEIIEFTRAQGADFHCQPTGRRLTHTQMLDWLADHLPARPA